MPIPILCQNCNARFSAPDTADGRTAKCPKCGAGILIRRNSQELTIPAQTFKPVEPTHVGPPDKPATHFPNAPAVETGTRTAAFDLAPDFFVSDVAAVGVGPDFVVAEVVPDAAPETKACPFCAEQILFAAKKCKHCGELLDPALRAQRAAEAKWLAPAVATSTTPARAPVPIGREVEAQAAKQKSKPTSPVAMGCLIVVVAFVGLMIFGPNTRTGSNSSGGTAEPVWSYGGTLHKKGALDWQVATAKDKLATCADIVATMWSNNDFVPRIQNSIHSVDDMRPYAQELVAFIDAATKKDEDDDQNRKMYANQTVASMATMGMMWMKWLK